MKLPSNAVLPAFRESGFVDYFIHDVQDDGEDVFPKFYGSAHQSGSVLILKQSNASTFRYFVAREGYETYWAGRADLDYDYIFNLNFEQ